jgi:N6-adenosine-specific RNA methylase IME4
MLTYDVVLCDPPWSYTGSQTKLEMFARRERAGWDSWGLEAPKPIPK